MARTHPVSVPVRFLAAADGDVLNLLRKIDRKNRQIGRLLRLSRRLLDRERQQEEAYAILAREVAEDAEFTYYANLAAVSEWCSSPAGGPPNRAA